MKIAASLLSASLALALSPYAPAQQASSSQPAKKPLPAVAHTHLKIGDVAPDFTMLSTDFKKIKLSDYRGKKNVVLAFYVLAFTGG